MNFCLAAIIAVFLFLVYEPVRYIFNKSIDAAQGVSIHDGAFYSIMAAVAAILDMVLIGYGWLYGRSQWVLQSDGSMTVLRNHRVCNIDDAVGLLKLGSRDPFVFADVIFFITAVILLVGVFLGSRRMAIPHILAKMVTIITQVVTLCVYLDPLYTDTLSRSPLENTLLSLAMLVLEIRMLLYTLSFYDYGLEYECVECPEECDDVDDVDVPITEDVDSGVYADAQSQASYTASASAYTPHAARDRTRIYEDLDNIPERDTPSTAQRGDVAAQRFEVRSAVGGTKRRLSFEDEQPRSALSVGQGTRRHSQESGRSMSFFSAEGAGRNERKGSKDSGRSRSFFSAVDGGRRERRGSIESGRSRSVHSASQATGRRTSKESGRSILVSPAKGGIARRTSGHSILASQAKGATGRKPSGHSIIVSHATAETGRRTSGNSIIGSQATGVTGRRTSGNSIIGSQNKPGTARKSSGHSIIGSQAKGGTGRKTSGHSILGSQVKGGPGRRTSGHSIIGSQAKGGTGRRTSGHSIIGSQAKGGTGRRTSGHSIIPSQATGATGRRSSKESGNQVSVYNVSHHTGMSNRRNTEDDKNTRSVDASLKKISKDIQRIERSLSVRSDMGKNDARSLTRSSRHVSERPSDVSPPSKAGGASARSTSKGGGASARSSSSGHTGRHSAERGTTSQATGHEPRDRSQRERSGSHDSGGSAKRAGGISHLFSSIPSFEPNHDDDFSVYVPFRSVSDFAAVQRSTAASEVEADTPSASERRIMAGRTSRAGDDGGRGAPRRTAASGSKTLTTITERSDRSSVLSDKGSRSKRDQGSARSSSSKRSKN